MLGWLFSREKSPKVNGLPLVFKNNEGFFEYQCKFGDVKLEEKKGLVAIVLDARKEFGTSSPVKVEADGSQLAMLRVASDDGGFVVPAKTASNGPLLKPGDLVFWVPIKHEAPLLPEQFEVDPRFFWVGFIVLKIDRVIDAGSKWRILSKYT